jgi:hypothetical protein
MSKSQRAGIATFWPCAALAGVVEAQIYDNKVCRIFDPLAVTGNRVHHHGLRQQVRF